MAPEIKKKYLSIFDRILAQYYTPWSWDIEWHWETKVWSIFQLYYCWLFCNIMLYYTMPLWDLLIFYMLNWNTYYTFQIHFVSMWLGNHSWQWCHKEHDGNSNHHRDDYLLNRWFGRRSKKTLKLCITDLCVENSLVHKGPVTRKCFLLMMSHVIEILCWYAWLIGKAW